MFKQTQQRSREEYSERIYRKEGYGRIPQLPIRSTVQSMEENRPSLNNITGDCKVQPVSAARSQEKHKGTSGKGIQVTSRPSSRQRKGLVTSRSRQRQKQSKEIKSQTNISQFEPYEQSKEPSISNSSPKKEHYAYFEQKLKQAMRKAQISFQLQLQQLKDIIQSNEERINNLICSLNTLLDKNEKKQKLIERLELRLESNSNYNQQCYEYTLTRCQNIQTIFRIIADEIDSQNIDRNKLEQEIKKAEIIMKDVFLIQRYKNKHIKEDAENEIRKLEKIARKNEEQVQCLKKMNEGRQSWREKEEELKQYIQEMRNELQRQYQQQVSLSFSSSPKKSMAIDKLQLLLDTLTTKLSFLQSQNQQLTQFYLAKEQKAQESIYELSCLLNKHERELEKKKKEIEDQGKYNLEMENKLIQSKLKENSLRVEMDSLCRGLQNSKMEEYGLLEKEKECYKSKFEESFRHGQELEDLNCKNKLVLLQQQQEIKELNTKLQTNQRVLFQKEKLKNELRLKEDSWSNRLRKQTQDLQSTLSSLKQENQSLLMQLKSNSNQILLLQTQLKDVRSQKQKLQHLYQNLSQSYRELEKQFKEEQLYSQHLESQNQQLTQNLNQYNSVFHNQSQMFKNTIQKLKKENIELHKTLESKAEKIFQNQPKKYQYNRITFGTISETAQTQMNSTKITKLIKNFTELGFSMPVPCEIDQSGYLKSYENGTFIYDPQGNPIELSTSDKEQAVGKKVIQLFQ